MEIDGFGASKLARSIVLHARVLEKSDMALALEREALLKIQLENIARHNANRWYGWMRGVETFKTTAEYAIGVLLSGFTLIAVIVLLPYFAYAMVAVMTDIWIRWEPRNIAFQSNPFKIMYDCVGSWFLDVVYPQTSHNFVTDAWFYLLNGTVNKCQCFLK